MFGKGLVGLKKHNAHLFQYHFCFTHQFWFWCLILIKNFMIWFARNWHYFQCYQPLKWIWLHMLKTWSSCWKRCIIIGLVGMGGIGKTLLSKKVFHSIHNQYPKSSFLENVGSRNAKDVLKQLLYGLCGKKLHKEEDVDEDDFQLIRQCLITKITLVVIDDVRAIMNFVALQVFVVISKIESKSKIIVNCWNWKILKAHLSEDGKVGMPLLNDVQVRELFMFHAFGGANYVPNDFKVISKKVVVACDGLPLSLEVLGIFLKKQRNIEI